MSIYFEKYLKYKNKYNLLKKHRGGGGKELSTYTVYICANIEQIDKIAYITSKYEHTILKLKTLFHQIKVVPYTDVDDFSIMLDKNKISCIYHDIHTILTGDQEKQYAWGLKCEYTDNTIVSATLFLCNNNIWRELTTDDITVLRRQFQYKIYDRWGNPVESVKSVDSQGLAWMD